MQNSVEGAVHFFCFWLGIPFWGKFYPWSWSLVPGNSKYAEFMLFTFFQFWPDILFLGKFGPKNQNCQFKLKFGMETDLNMQSSVVVFIFSDLDWKYFFWANLVQKIKIATLSWNMVPRLIWICRIQWKELFTFFVFDWEYPFEANFIREAEVWYLEIPNMQNSCCSLFSNFDQIYSF